MGKSEVRVETGDGVVRIVRDPSEAQRIGCSAITVVPIGDVVSAAAVPGPKGSRYLRVEATRAKAHPDPESDPLAVRFERRQAHEADRLAAMIQRNVLVASGQATPSPLQDETYRRNLNRAATFGMWSAGLTAVSLALPLVVAMAIIVVIALVILL